MRFLPPFDSPTTWTRVQIGSEAAIPAHVRGWYWVVLPAVTVFPRLLVQVQSLGPGDRLLLWAQSPLGCRRPCSLPCLILGVGWGSLTILTNRHSWCLWGCIKPKYEAHPTHTPDQPTQPPTWMLSFPSPYPRTPPPCTPGGVVHFPHLLTSWFWERFCVKSTGIAKGQKQHLGAEEQLSHFQFGIPPPPRQFLQVVSTSS